MCSSHSYSCFKLWWKKTKGSYTSICCTTKRIVAKIIWKRGETVDSQRYFNDRLDRHLKEYSSKVQRGKGSKRSNMIIWHRKFNVLFDILGKGVDPGKFDIVERNFYYDQVTLNRKMKIDADDIDADHEEKLIEAEMMKKMEEEMELEEWKCALGDDQDCNSSTSIDNTNLNFSMNRSGLICQVPSTCEF